MPSTRSATAAPKAAPSRTARPARPANPASRASRAASRPDAPPDPTIRNLRDPWFTLIQVGAKTRHVHWAEPKPATGGRPAAPGFENLAKGDVITWRNTSLGFPRLCRVVVTSVVFKTTATVVADVTTPAMMKAMFPTLTDAEQVKAALGGLAKSPVDRKVVIFAFKLA